MLLLLTAFGFVLMFFGGWLTVAFTTSAQQVSQARLVGMLMLGVACIVLGGIAAWAGYHPGAGRVAAPFIPFDPVGAPVAHPAGTHGQTGDRARGALLSLPYYAPSFCRGTGPPPVHLCRASEGRVWDGLCLPGAAAINVDGLLTLRLETRRFAARVFPSRSSRSSEPPFLYVSPGGSRRPREAARPSIAIAPAYLRIQ